MWRECLEEINFGNYSSSEALASETLTNMPACLFSLYCTSLIGLGINVHMHILLM